MSEKTIFVRPAEGLQVRDPKDGAPIPAEGTSVPDTSYWRRRLRDGDVVQANAKAAAKNAKAAAAAEPKEA